MKKILLTALIAGCMVPSTFAALKEVVKEASGSGVSQHQAISEALLLYTVCEWCNCFITS